MRTDIGRLHIEKVIVHDIPSGRVSGAAQPPILSEIESPLRQQLRNYFREKIVRSLTSAAFDVEFDPTTTSPVPDLVLDNLGDQTKDFVAMSRETAQHLYDSQTGVNPPGLLSLAQASVRGRRAIGVLKLEREEGLRLQQSQLEGKSTVNLEHLRDLMLTQKTKVFKVGLFVQMGNTLESIDGAVSDNQRGYYPTTEVADFFLKRFLGCKLREAPEITTKRLFQATEDFIRDVISEPEVKARYEIALLAELSSEAKTFAPRSFADRYLRVADRQVYISFLADVEIAPQPFDKGTDLIDTHLKRIQIDFESGIGVLGKPDTFDDHVKMEDLALIPLFRFPEPLLSSTLPSLGDAQNYISRDSPYGQSSDSKGSPNEIVASYSGPARPVNLRSIQ